MIPNRNTLWARILVDELVRNGVRRVVLSPGSRSTPLLLAFDEAAGVETVVHIDERGAAYLALGLARASGEPVAVVSTSGTAAANYTPAVVEADQDGLPLIVLTADRPYELRGVGANQAIDQLKIYGDRVRWFVDIGLPETETRALRHLRATAARAVAHATASSGGPVHLNVPFRKPLEPTPVADDVPTDLDPLVRDGRPGGERFLRINRAKPTPDAAVLDEVARRLADSRRGVMVAGPRWCHDGLPARLVELADRLGVPLLADPLSGVRCGMPRAHATMLRHELWLGPGPVRDGLRPDWVLQVGGTPTSAHVAHWFEAHPETHRILIDETGRSPDASHTAHRVLHSDPVLAVDGLLDRVDGAAGGADEWSQTLRGCEQAAEEVVQGLASWEGSVPGAALEGLDDEDVLFVSSSLPVRDLDKYGGTTEAAVRILANRGASGIDGVLASAAGAVRAASGRGRLVIGDVALAHDLNALSAVRDHAPGLTVIVMDNGGGRIFDQLPVAALADVAYEKLFRTPPRLDWSAAATTFGLDHVRVEDAADLPAALADADGGLVEVVVDGDASVARRRHISQAVAEAVGPVARGQTAAGPA